MEQSKRISMIILILTGLLVIGLLIFGATRPVKAQSDEFRLKSYQNSVALYNGEELLEVFDGIVLDNLPESDRMRLNSGISFSTQSEAMRAVEDYDG